MPSKKQRGRYFRSAKKQNRKATKALSVGSVIYDTLCYRAVFNYPLSFYQLSTFLMSGKEVSKKEIERELQELVRNKTVRKFQGKYHLSNIRPVSWYYRAKNTQTCFDDIKPVFKTLEKIPWIKLLAVTGPLAAHNASKDDDVDIFIISQAKRVWLTRFFVVVLLKILGKYRTDESPSGKVCPNIYISELSLPWDEEKRNLFIAHEIVMMHPVINRDNAYFRFLSKNDWVFDYFGNFKIQYPNLGAVEAPESAIVNFMEKVSMWVQLKYMEDKKTTEITTKNVIHFNRDDSTNVILEKYKEIKSGIEVKPRRKKRRKAKKS